jgi:regulator of sigma E protease
LGILNGLTPILMVVLGLGFVIFIHELGHFALAKWADVKVDKFSIGFGPTLIGFRRGETEYAISAIPLGGFVKMLGENPSEDGQEATTDPRSYLNKSVGQRMAIISAGVIMNIITAVGFFALSYRLGTTYTPAVIGMVSPDSPAYKAGIRPGDEFLALDEQVNPSFEDLLRKVSTTHEGQVLHMKLKRGGGSETYEADVVPVLRPGRLKPEVGLGMSGDLILGSENLDSLAGIAPGSKIEGDARPGDRILGVTGPDGAWIEVTTEQELKNALSKFRSQPVKLKLAASKGEDTKPREVTVPPVSLFGLGIRFETGPVVAVIPGSPAAAAGISPGDTIVEVAGKPVDSRTLPGITFDSAGKPLELTIADTAGAKRQVTVTPRLEAVDHTLNWAPSNRLTDVGPLGLCYFVTPKVAAVDAGSPAEKAGIKAGQTVESVRLDIPKPPARSLFGKLGEMLSPLTRRAILAINPNYVPDDPNYFVIASKPDNSDQSADSVQSMTVDALTGTLNFIKVPSVKLTVSGAEKPLDLVPAAESGLFVADRGLIRLVMERPLPPQSFSVSITRGFDDARRGVGEIYRTLRALITQRVSRKLLGGPVTIAQAAHASASEGLGKLMSFLGMLSINLAVLNFLPIAPLDGGQMVLLMGEKIRGKPLPDRLQVVYTLIGLSFVLGLMLMVVSQDILRVLGFM